MPTPGASKLTERDLRPSRTWRQPTGSLTAGAPPAGSTPPMETSGGAGPPGASPGAPLAGGGRSPRNPSATTSGSTVGSKAPPVASAQRSAVLIASKSSGEQRPGAQARPRSRDPHNRAPVLL